MKFRMIPNANPNGRQLVEEGHYCWRGNAQGVDLNRNWAHTSDDAIRFSDEEYPGETHITSSLIKVRIKVLDHSASGKLELLRI